MRRTLLVLGLLLAATACAPNVGPDGLLIGGPCEDDTFCVTGAYCLTGRDFPNGTCTTVCDDDGDCRGDSACIERGAGVCLLRCEEDADCGREGYVCRELTQRGETGSTRVCAGG
jgi:hypothetical protein